jgi:iron-sulfur cluster insertion protein
MPTPRAALCVDNRRAGPIFNRRPSSTRPAARSDSTCSPLRAFDWGAAQADNGGIGEPEYRMNAMNEMPSALVFTDAAAAKVRTLIDEEGNPDLKLRVFVSGGGCSGFQYGFTFDEVVNEDDTAMQKAGVTLLIDPMSYQYLVGAEIDYQEGLEGAQFVIKNPNATTTCGCGSSFST